MPRPAPAARRRRAHWARLGRRRRRSRRRPGLPAAEIADVELARVDEAGPGVVDAVGERLLAERLGLDEDAAQLALVEIALLLHGVEQRLAVQVAVAEV